MTATVPPSSVVVTGVGMMTPVGLSAEATYAAIRGGISMIGELEYFVIENDWFEEVPLAGCAIAGVTDGYLGLGRWTRLATGAISNVLETAGLSDGELSAAGLYLALPSTERSGVDTRITQMLGLRIGEWLGIESLERRTRVYPLGHAAGAAACQGAVADLIGGGMTHALVCGVDSLVEPDTLQFLYEKKRLKTEDNVDGFIPGEGSACMLLEPRGSAESRGAEVLAGLEAPSTATEAVTIWSDDPSPATGLSEAIAGTLGQLADQGMRTGLVVCDLNGELYRSKEFGITVPRVLNRVQTDWDVLHPADCIGDTGAASFAISTCIGTATLQEESVNADGVLVWGSSDDGLRGSVYLRSAN